MSLPSRQIDYLGLPISPDGLKPSAAKVAAVADFPTPASAAQNIKNSD
jgi:hypothetical protein